MPLGVSPQESTQAATTVYAFNASTIINEVKTNDQSAPVIAKLSGRDVMVVWQDPRSGNEDIYTSVSHDNGTTFAMNIRADDSTDGSKQIEPAVAVSRNGTIFLAWQDNRRSTFDYDIYLSKSINGGLTFTPNVKVDDSVGAISWQERPSIAVTQSGTVYVAWTDDRTHGLRVRGAFSTNAGASFSPSEDIVPGTTSGQTGISLVSNGDRIFAAFMDNVTGVPHPYICVSTNGGDSFSAPSRIDKAGPTIGQRGVTIAPRPDGGVAAVWEDSRNGDWDIYATILDLNGVGIGADYRVDDDTTGSYQYGASVTSDRSGNIYVVWEDERNLVYAIRFSYMKVGNSTFTPSIEVSTPRGDTIQRRASIVTTDPGRVVVTWQDDGANTYDIYAATGWFPNLFDLKLVKGWNLVSISLSGWNYKASTLGLRTGDVVYAWNSTSERYDKTYTVGMSPLFKDFFIDGGTGYWIFTNAPETLNLYGSLPAPGHQKQVNVPDGGGWAAVGFESLNSSRRASDIPTMYSVAGAVRVVTAYDATTGIYKQYSVGRPFGDFKLMPGWAYWIWCSVSGTLSYDP